MNIIQIIRNAIAFIAALLASKQTLKEENERLRTELSTQAEQLATQRDTILELQRQVVEDDLDDQALEEAAGIARENAAAAVTAKEEAEARLAARVEADAPLEAAAQELAQAISENPEIPLTVDPASFATTT